MIVANDVEIPDNCEHCLQKIESFYQGSLCTRCPVFSCKEIPGPDGEPFCLVERENYRKDWALEFKKFFETGEYPNLYIALKS